MIVRKSGKICLTEKDPSKKTFLDGIGTIMQTENKKRIIRTFFNVRIILLWWEEVDLNHRSRRRQIYRQFKVNYMQNIAYILHKNCEILKIYTYYTEEVYHIGENMGKCFP